MSYCLILLIAFNINIKDIISNHFFFKKSIVDIKKSFGIEGIVDNTKLNTKRLTGTAKDTIKIVLYELNCLIGCIIINRKGIKLVKFDIDIEKIAKKIENNITEYTSILCEKDIEKTKINSAKNKADIFMSTSNHLIFSCFSIFHRLFYSIKPSRSCASLSYLSLFAYSTSRFIFSVLIFVSSMSLCIFSILLSILASLPEIVSKYIIYLKSVCLKSEYSTINHPTKNIQHIICQLFSMNLTIIPIVFSPLTYNFTHKMAVCQAAKGAHI